MARHVVMSAVLGALAIFNTAGLAHAQDDVTDATLDSELHAAGVTALSPPNTPDTRNAALVKLGQALFYDKIISGNKNMACASCHSPMQGAGMGDGLGISLGAGSRGVGPKRTFGGNWIRRHAPTVINIGLKEYTTLFWDGRVSIDPATGKLTDPDPALSGGQLAESKQLTTALAELAMFPPTTDEEMSASGWQVDMNNRKAIWDAIMSRLLGANRTAAPAATDVWVAQYRSMFLAAYPGSAIGDFNFGHAARAIAAFVTATYTAVNTPLDRYLKSTTPAQKAQALPATSPERLGAVLFFGKAKCANCHNGPILSDQKLHSDGAPKTDFFSSDMGANNAFQFRTMPLRNVAVHPNYMHGGAYKTLGDVVNHYLNPVADLQTIVANPSKAATASQQGFGTTFSWSDPAPQALITAAQNEPLLPQKLDLTPDEVKALVAFLQNGLTDGAVIGDKLLKTAPDSVPSGLRGGVPKGDGSAEDPGVQPGATTPATTATPPTTTPPPVNTPGILEHLHEHP
jgi:cytochrome c peroxidase